MPNSALLETLLRQIDAGKPPSSSEEAATIIKPLTIGLRSKVLVLAAGTRLFRVRAGIVNKPLNISDVGAPPEAKVVRWGRLNEPGQSVLYVANAPYTAFKEVCPGPGRYCLSEWRVVEQRVGIANGGIHPQVFAPVIPMGSESSALRGVEDEEVATFFRRAFTLSVGETERLMYR